ncbi:unnamed protein product [Lepeophtheirus salmonis]|uniref:(salmon louse) hypothetical protein n=1 Tax=Lepeophtheirus salmonis TaxID=72036 RepID=A0A7R8H598_LEPSM|nr:unnamed protein product [Lepeophtheirus salmonis]CAF2872708.1 unnamed protein product [Lepeophtheirus salmonis]
MQESLICATSDGRPFQNKISILSISIHIFRYFLTNENKFKNPASTLECSVCNKRYESKYYGMDDFDTWSEVVNPMDTIDKSTKSTHNLNVRSVNKYYPLKKSSTEIFTRTEIINLSIFARWKNV